MYTSFATRRRNSPRFKVLAHGAKSASLWLVAGLFAAAVFAGPALADNRGERPQAVRLLTTIPIPGDALHSFDISRVDAQTQRYYLADRSNKAIDVIDAMNGTFLKQISGGFKGVVYNAAGGADNSATATKERLQLSSESHLPMLTTARPSASSQHSVPRHPGTLSITTPAARMRWIISCRCSGRG